MKPSGAHTHPELASGGGLAAVAALIGAAILAVPIAQAVASVLAVVLITCAAAIAVAAAGLATFLVVYLRRTATPPRQPVQLAASTHTTALHAQRRPGLGAAAPSVHLHLHGLSAEDITDALTRTPIPPTGG